MLTNLKFIIIALAIAAYPATFFVAKQIGKTEGNEQALKAYIETIGDIDEVTAPDDPLAVLRELCELAEFKPDRCSDLRRD